MLVHIVYHLAGCKVLVLGGDLRQILLVIGGTRTTVNASITNLPL